VADCNDKRFEEMLHAYELGMLSDDDREKFEMHLMECEVCFEKVQKLMTAVGLVRHDSEVHAVIEKEAARGDDQTESDPSEVKASIFKRKLWPSLVPSAIVVALLVVLILKPWQIEISPTQEAVAIENRLAIMYFENLADPDDEHNLGEIITSLLITDLSESEYVSVISSQRLYDIARIMGKDERSSLDRETAMEIARRADARWMLLGSIHQTEPYFSLAGQLIDVSTGDVIASQLIAGEPGDDIFPLIDKLTTEVKNDLTLPSAAMQEQDRMVADVTTHSSTAYRYYIEGIDYFDKFYMDEARACFSKAVEHDSTFAMAYYYLTRVTSGEKADKNLKLASTYMDKVSQKEKFYIRSLQAAKASDYSGAIEYLEQLLKRYPDEKEALFLIANYYYSKRNIEKLAEYLERVIALDPFHKSSYNMLAYAYHFLGKNERSIEMADRYVALAPDEANPYDTRGDLLNRMGRFDEAIESYEKAVEIKPDFSSSRLALIYLNLFRRQYSRAEERVAEYAESGMENAESQANLYLSHIYIFRGETDSALKIIDMELEKNRSGKNYSLLGEGYYTKAMIYDGLGNYDRAIEYIRKAEEAVSSDLPSKSLSYKHAEIVFLARAGKFDEAERFLEDYGSRTEDIPLRVGRYYYCRGVIAFEKGDYKTAISELKQSLEDRKSFSYLTNYLLARSYIKTEQYAEAIDIFEENLNNYDLWRMYYGIQDSKTYYYLGLANEKLGRNEKAVKMYDYFLEIWKDADPGFTELADARQRLKRLKNRS